MVLFMSSTLFNYIHSSVMALKELILGLLHKVVTVTGLNGNPGCIMMNGWIWIPKSVEYNHWISIVEYNLCQNHTYYRRRNNSCDGEELLEYIPIMWNIYQFFTQPYNTNPFSNAMLISSPTTFFRIAYNTKTQINHQLSTMLDAMTTQPIDFWRYLLIFFSHSMLIG